MLNRGQTQEIFTWIFVIIVASAILFFGAKLLINTNELKDDVLVVKFFNDIDKKLNQYYFLDKGSSGEEKFSLPTNVKWICFMNTTGEFVKEHFISEEDFQLMKILGQYSNLFVGPLNLYEENRFNLTTKITMNENPKCFSINNQLTIDLENLGVKQGVEIK